MLQKRTKSDAHGSWRGDIPVHHRYTLGVAGERFFKAMRDARQLLACHCPKCNRMFLPPKLYCESCFERTDDWTPVVGPAYLKTFTVLHLDLEGEPLRQPQVVGLVAWEGVQGGLIHRIEGVGESHLKTGMGLEPVWAEERNGSLEDIRFFQPQQG